jgi:hypothetical protein
MMASTGSCCLSTVSLQELVEGGFFFQVFFRRGIERLHLVEFFRRQLWEMANEVDQLPTVLVLAGSPSPQAGMAVERMPLWITQKISPSHIDWISGSRRSSALGLTFLPIGVWPLPSLLRQAFSGQARRSLPRRTVQVRLGVSRLRVPVSQRDELS